MNRQLSSIVASILVGASLASPVPAAAQPPNDDIAAAVAVTKLPFNVTTSNAGATTQAAEPEPACTFGVKSTLWYAYTPSHDFLLVATALGDVFVDPFVAAYTGSGIGDLAEIGCAFRSGPLTVATQAGRTIYFQVGGGAPTASPGTLTFSLAQQLPPQPRQLRQEILNLREDGLFANFFYTEGDATTYVAVTAAALGELRPPRPGGPASDSFITVTVFRARANGDVILSGVSLAPAPALAVSGDLGSARLRESVLFFSEVDALFYALDVDLTFTATGPVQRQRFTERTSDPGGGYAQTLRVLGDFRPAVAAGGVIFQPFENSPPSRSGIPFGTNFTPYPSPVTNEFGEPGAATMRNRYGSITLERTP